MKYHLINTPCNNHGCVGFNVTVEADPLSREGVVVDGYSCSSCWQVGHDCADSPIPVGLKVELPDWCDCWDDAAELAGRSHNELVEDSDEEPSPDCTFVTPADLFIVHSWKEVTQ